MKVMVTGATGYLGSYLIKALLKNGHQVIALKRSFSDTTRITDELPRIAVYNIDQCDLEQPFKDHEDLDVVIHAATCYGRKGEKPLDIISANTTFPIKLLEMAASYGTAAFINTDTALPRDLNCYSLSKAHFADWGRYYAYSGKIRFVNIRLEHFYGPLDDVSKFSTHVMRSCFKNVPELKLTAGEQERDFIYIDDVISAYLLLISTSIRAAGLYQNYELGSGKAIAIRSFVETVHRLAKSTTRLDFGALSYRDKEVMRSEADIAPLKAMGWSNKTDLITGIKACLQKEGTR